MKTVGKLLDTNAVIAIINQAYLPDSLLQNGQNTYVSVIVVSELLYGALKSSRVEDNVQSIEQFFAKRSVLDLDTQTARTFAAIKDALRRKGRPIPENDIWIAASAVQHHLSVVTRDKHFSYIDGVVIESW